MKLLSPQAVVAVAALPNATAALAGAVMRLTTDNKPYWCDGAAWFDLRSTGHHRLDNRAGIASA